MRKSSSLEKDCYELDINVFQLCSVLDINCEWKSLLGRKRYWEKEVVVHHNKIYQTANVRRAHDECGCDRDVGEEFDYLEVGAQSIALREPYIVHNKSLIFFNLGVSATNGQVSLFDPDIDAAKWPPTQRTGRNWTIDPDATKQELVDYITSFQDFVPGDVFPRYLRFLAGIEAGTQLRISFQNPQTATPVLA